MRKLIFISLALLWAGALTAQDITGDWHAAFDAQGQQIRLILHINEEDGQLSATLDSPDQSAMGLAVRSITFEEGLLKFSMKDFNASYSGKYENGGFTGTWTQTGVMALNLMPFASFRPAWTAAPSTGSTRRGTAR